VTLKGYSSQLIDFAVVPEDGNEWRATLVYGEPRKELRHQFWDRLRFLSSQWRGPWICASDFNEALSGDEHMVPRDRDDNQMSLFRDCLDDRGLMDMGFTGPKYTWSNRQAGANNIRVRLDRAVGNGDFLNLYDECRVENIFTTSSDHYALLINLAKRGDLKVRQPVHSYFMFEAAWMRAPDYMEVVEKTWEAHKQQSPSLITHGKH
jgi:hypothetical protein